MPKLSFVMSAPEPQKAVFPVWFRVGLYVFLMSTCGMLIVSFASQGR